jgi:D-lactate dehydrogenase (cytochrome)
MNKAREFDQSVLAELKALLGERLSTSAAVREHHGKDESYFPTPCPTRWCSADPPKKCATW